MLSITQAFWKSNNILFLISGLLFLSCSNPKTNEQVVTGEALGTTYQVKFFHEEEIPLKKGLDSVFEVINSSMSTYQNNSDISRINAGDSTVTVDEHFRKVFNDSRKIYRESKGHFDPTVGNLVNAYGFGPERGNKELSQFVIDSMMQYVGLNKIELTADGRIKKEHPEIYVDFNAIAKGYAVDVMGEFLDQNGIQDYLIELGGELLAKGINRKNDVPWTVGIDDPAQTSSQRILTAALRLEDRGMATSGNYRKFRIDSLTGLQYVHTINPLTGRSEKSDLLSATVLAPTCALADGYATAFMSLGFEGSLDMLERVEDIDVYFIYAGKENEMKVFTTPAFEEALLRD
ncbi:FAD:protein FMN transferase [Antarcticibacterium flavum]|uniref:FAD:protein FMN transferase n=1 Tax=Antarcticibacterium flavum TaxID=2058175 RepID=A0A5B7X6T8_9FLAO|nr:MULTISPECIES: FAD:protein FMN transferase [Antarcticibacterium]MCM4160053.1 FAD:protein FMN transferase [Antarcticibacterium sp. W02-3]QCY70361.1 FAD:protein FMN transferase [Antarcticibacterium flavum]